MASAWANEPGVVSAGEDRAARLIPSTVGIKLLETATQEDAERIADCLRESLGSGEESIRSPNG